MEYLAEIVSRDGFVNTKTCRLVVGTAIGTKHDVHQRGQVRVIAGVAITVMVPMVKFGPSDQHS